MRSDRWTRRNALALGLAAGGLLLPRPLWAQAGLTATPTCPDGDEPTPRQTEGPYFTPNSPERADFVVDGIEGPRIRLTGFALDTDCRPIPGALLDLWHCDAEGRYDNQGYRLRGHVFSDAEGRYAFETIVPGLYPGRTRHFHVKVQPPGGEVLTTQLYFPGEAANDRDRIFDAGLLLEMNEAEGTRIGRFDFVVKAA